MATVQETINQLRERRAETSEALGGVSDAQLILRVGERSDVRTTMLRLPILMHQRRVELAETLAGLGWWQSEAQRILGLTREARGELRALLLGLADADVDRAPASDEWSVRQAIEHLHVSDVRYLMGAEYAVERVRKGGDLPIQRPEEGMPPRGVVPHLEGGVAALLAQLERLRDGTVWRLQDTSDQELAAPVMNQGRQSDLRYRLHLFPGHEREHTGQMARALRALGVQQSEAQMILGQVEVAHGGVEAMLVGLPDELLARATDGRPSVAQIVADAVAEEGALVSCIANAIA